MNTIYRIIFNRATSKWVVASELAKGRTKSSTTKTAMLSSAFALFIGGAALSQASLAADIPTGAQISNAIADAFDTDQQAPSVIADNALRQVNEQGVLSAPAMTRAVGAPRVASGMGGLQLCNEAATDGYGWGSSGNNENIGNCTSTSGAFTFSINNSGTNTGLGGFSTSTARVTGYQSGLLELMGQGGVSILGPATFSAAANMSNNQINGLANGVLPTDAVNVSQLTPAITALGGGATINATTGVVTGPSYTVQGGTQTTVGGALTSLDSAVTKNSGDITDLQSALDDAGLGLVEQDATSGNINVGADANGTAVDFTGTAGARKLSGVAAGVAQTDAVNVSQLSPVVDALGGGAAIDANTGAVTSPSYTVQGAPQTTVGGALTSLDSAVTTNAADIAKNTGDIAQNTTNITNLQTSLNDGTVGLVQQATAGDDITVAKDLDGAAVDFTGTAGARKLSGVAAGTAQTDAVNVSQLSPVVDALGGGAAIDANTGAVTGPSYAIQGGTQTTIGGALGSLDSAVTKNTGDIVQNTTDITNLQSSLGDGTVGLVQQAAAGDDITVAKDLDGAAVDFTGTAGARKLSGVAAGVAQTDAVNVSQLSPVVDALGGGAAIDANTGAVTGPSYSIQGGTQTTVGGALTSLDTAVTKNTGDISDLQTAIGGGAVGLVQQDATSKNITVAKDLDGTAVDFTGTAGARKLSGVAAGVAQTDAVNVSQLSPVIDALGGGAAIDANTGAVTGPSYAIQGGTQTTVGGALTSLDTAVTSNTNNITKNAGDISDLQTALGDGSVGLVQQDATSKHITVAKDTDGTVVDFSNSAGATRTLSGVSAGLAATDAVNVSQLGSVVAGLGGGAAIDPNTGLMTGPNYVLQNGGAQTTIGGALGALDSAVSTHTSEITDINNAIAGMMGPGGQVPERMVAYDDLSLGRVTFAGGANGTLLTNVASGNIAQGSMDAINGGQMWQLQQQFDQLGDRVTAVESGLAQVGTGTGSGNNAGSGENSTQVGGDASGNGSTATGVDASASGENSTATGSNSTASGNGSTATGSGSVASGENSTANGQSSVASGNGSTALGQNAQATGQTSTALGSNSTASGDNSVALGAGSVADRANTVSVGSEGNERQITNVAAGTAITDAVNVGQLNEVKDWAQNYTDQRFNQLDNKVDKVNRRASAGTAAAIAVANMPSAYAPGQSAVSAGVGTYNGQSALSVGMSTISESGRWSYKFSATASSQGDAGAGFGVGYSW